MNSIFLLLSFCIISTHLIGGYSYQDNLPSTSGYEHTAALTRSLYSRPTPIASTGLNNNDPAGGCIIDTPGNYVFPMDLNYSPANSGTAAIVITASNVILDLDDSLLTQGNSAASVSAIKISDNVSNVRIRNGHITGFTENTTGAINISSGCKDIVLESLVVSNCSGTGIYVTGCRRFKMLNIYSGDHAGTASAVIAGLNAVSTNEIIIEDCDFSFISTNQAVAAAGARFDNCSGIVVENSKASNNTNTNATPASTTHAQGWALINDTGACKNFHFYNCQANAQSATAGTAHGFYIVGGTSGYFEDCQADYNQSPQTSGAANTLDGLNAYGFCLISTSACIFDDCKARYQLTGNSGTTAQYRDAVGFYSRLGNANKFTYCESAYNSSGGTFNSSQTVASGGGGRPGSWPLQAVYYGYLLNPDTGVTTAPTFGEQTSYSAGFYLHAETGSTIRECAAYSNTAGNTSTRTSPASTTPVGPSSNNGIAVGIYLNRLAISSTGTPPSYTVQPCHYCVIVNNLVHNNQSFDSTGYHTCRSIGIWDHAQAGGAASSCWLYNESQSSYSMITTTGTLLNGSSSTYAGNVTIGHGQSWSRGNILLGSQYGTNIADPTLVNDVSPAVQVSAGGFNFFARYDGLNNTGANYLLEAAYAQQTNINTSNTGTSAFGPFGIWNWSFIHG